MTAQASEERADAKPVERAASRRYVCPLCEKESESAGRCPDDHTPLLVWSKPPTSPSETEPMTALTARLRTRRYSPAALAVGALLLLFASWLGIPIDKAHDWTVAVTLVISVVLLMVVGIVEGVKRFKRSWLTTPSEQQESLAPAPVETLRDAQDGMVRVRGRIRVMEGAEDPDGLPRIVFPAASEHGRDTARGTVFELAVADGTRVVVRASWVKIPREFHLGERFVIPQDTEVEIVGKGCLIADEATAHHSFRQTVQLFEIAAPDGEPLVLTRAPKTAASATTQEPTRVRAEETKLRASSPRQNADEEQSEDHANSKHLRQ